MSIRMSVEIDPKEMIMKIINEVGMKSVVNQLNKMDQEGLIAALTEEVNDGTFPLELLVGKVVVSRMTGIAEQKNHDMNKESA